ncbi:MAG: hypothetical protein Q8O67_26815 [Deltaproteobacteria bacterium]|nr:hypothetical protein [Deltaproteobacteria bacterium]
MLRSSTTMALCVSAVSLSFLIGCPTPPGEGEGDEGEGEGEGEGEIPGDGDCPVVAGANSVCDVQDSASDNAVDTGAAVTLPGVVATSPSFGSSFTDGVPSRFNVYVADNPNAKRGGVLVTWFADAGLPTDIVIGDVLTVSGQVSEFSLAAGDTETRIDAQTIVKDGGNSPLLPLVVTEADLLGVKAEDYEGVLVTVNDVETASTNQFGFTLTGGVNVSSAIFDYASVVGETFTSITGVIRFDIFDGAGFEVQPRQGSDVVSEGSPTNTVTELNDGTLTRCPGNADFNQCVAAVSGVVIAAPDFLFDDEERGALFGFYVADPANVDANGRLNRNSAVLVTISPADPVSPVTLTGYTFEQDENRKFLPGAAPEVGDVVEFTGDNAQRFDERAVRFTSRLKKVSTTTPPLPALFGTGGLDVSELKGGRPDIATGDFPGLEGIPASATIEDWEGVLVELKDVSTTTACYSQVNATTSTAADFGNFLVTGDVEISDSLNLDQEFSGFWFPDHVPNNADKVCTNLANKCEDSRALGQTFTKLVGIVNFSFGVHRVNPRGAADFEVTPGFVAEGTPAANCP